MAGTLYLVPTTLDIVRSTDPRKDTLGFGLPPAVRDLAAKLDFFIAENAKSARAFLKASGTTVPIQQIDIRELNVNTPASALDELLAPVMTGRDVGLLSEAGCPAIADPGANLVRRAHELGIRVRPLVGPSSILLTVMASGLSGQSFAFHGYLPTDANERRHRLVELESRSKREHQTQVFIETPYRNAALLDALAESLGDQTDLCVACDLTLPTEIIETRPAPHWRGRGKDFHKRPAVFAFLAR